MKIIKGIAWMGLIFLVGFLMAVFSGTVVPPTSETFQFWSYWKTWDLSDQIGFISMIIGIFSLIVAFIGLQINSQNFSKNHQNITGNNNIQIAPTETAIVDKSKITNIYKGKTLLLNKTSDHVDSKFNHFKARPSDLTRSFDNYISEKTTNFVGREFIFEELDRFLNEKNTESGYFIIKGEPGIGKSAIISHLVLSRGYIHHFNIALQNIVKPKQFIESICCQLIAKYSLMEPDWIEHRKEDLYKDGAYLNQLLFEASKRLVGNEKLIIAIDALDEVDNTDISHRSNILYLPTSLPPNTYLILTTRHKHDLQLYADNIRVFEIESGAEKNTSDMQLYIEQCLQDDILKREISYLDIDDNLFIEQLLRKSAGNFMYLRHVIPEIKKGKYREGRLEDLPDTLKGYYRNHWRQIQIEDSLEFETFYQPIICVLAATREALPEDKISAFTKINIAKVRLIIRKWREFLHKDRNKKGEFVFRIYHKSFQDFLSEEVDPGLKIHKKMIAKHYVAFMNLSEN